MTSKKNSKKEIDLLKEYKKAFQDIVLEEEKEGFLIHFFVYLFVIVGTILYLLINKNLNLETFKPLCIVFLGWTLAIVIHYFEAFYWAKEHIAKKEEIAELKVKKELK